MEPEKQGMAKPKFVAYSLDLQKEGGQCCYVWRYFSAKGGEQKAECVLIDLNGIFVPEAEIDSMMRKIEMRLENLQAVAFNRCPAANQRMIKRKLKMCDIRLYSKTAFFGECVQAKQWLEAQVFNC